MLRLSQTLARFAATSACAGGPAPGARAGRLAVAVAASPSASSATSPLLRTFTASSVAQLLPTSLLRSQDSASEAPAAAESTEIKTVFVGQLAWEVDSETLEAEFEECGEITSAKVISDRISGRSRGFGYVEFASADMAKKALALDGKEIDGRAINVDLATPRPTAAAGSPAGGRDGAAPPRGRREMSGPPTETLFVANVPFSATEDDLAAAFEEFGSVTSVRLPIDRNSGLARGIGYVEFESVDAAKKAVQAAGPAEGSEPIELDGRMLRLDYSQPRDVRRAGFGGGGGGGRDDRRGGGRGGGYGRSDYGGDRGDRGDRRGDRYGGGGGRDRYDDRGSGYGYGRQGGAGGGGRDYSRRDRY